MNENRRIALRESPAANMRTCTCGALVRWGLTTRGKRIALNGAATIEHDGDVVLVRADDVHWASCPDATKHRRPRAEASDRAAAPAIADRIERLEQSAAALRELLHQVAQRVRAGDTRQQVVELIEGRLIEIERQAGGPSAADVYPRGSRYHGD